MGAFYLIRRNAAGDPDVASQRLRASFKRQGFGEPSLTFANSCEIGFYDRLVAHGSTRIKDQYGAIACCAGTFFYRKAGGTDALRALLVDLHRNMVDWNELWGTFALITVIDGVITIATDRTGTFHLYVDSNQGVFSTSFLALAESLPTLTVDQDGLYDYVFQGAPHGRISVFQEINLFDSTRIFEIGDALRTRAWPELSAYPHGHDLDDCAAQCLDLLGQRFHVIADTFGDRISTGLSGGYDSRLVLALLFREGVRPKVSVYGRATNPDVRVAYRIATAANFELEHTDKSLVPLVEPDFFPTVVAANCDAFDGYPNDGIFNSGVDLATRRSRISGGELMLNGGGGEIFRNFYYLPDAGLSVGQLLRCFYTQFDARFCTARFDSKGYLERLGHRVVRAVNGTGMHLTRRQAEEVYSSFRCRFWMGRNNSVNNRLGFALTPFIDAEIVEAALSVPLELKNAGRLEARMITLASAQLASQQSNYGYSFSQPPPFSYRMLDLARRIRPPFLRQFSYQLRHLHPVPFAAPLTPDYVNKAIGGRFDYLEQFFLLNEFRDPEQYNRICTLEYLFKRLVPKLN